MEECESRRRVRADFVSEELGDEEEVWAPGFFDLEAQVSYRFKAGFTFFVNGYNLLNAGNQQFNPRPPRGVLGGVQWEY